MKYLMVTMLLLAVSAQAQTAQVIQLSPADAKQAKALHDELATIKARVESFDEGIARKYSGKECVSLHVAGAVVPCTKTDEKAYMIGVSPGWENGFEYSEDYRFIVPKPFSGKEVTLKCKIQYSSDYPCIVTTIP